MDNKKALTQKQQRVLEFIRARIKESMPPTIREIAREMGFSSTGTVRDYLSALEKKGYLKRRENLSRAMGLTDSPAFKIPILAGIAAGKPGLAYEDIEGYVDPDDLFLGRVSQNDVFALRVKGESMIEAGITDGDIAIIKKQPAADHGDIVAALLKNNEATLKRLRKKDRHYYLEAANKDYPPIFEEFEIIGRLITIIRKY